MRWWLSVAAFYAWAAIIQGQPARAQTGCEAASAGLKQLAGGVQTEITAPKGLKAGGTFEFTWQAATRFPPGTPVYLVLAIPGEVRFDLKPEPLSQTADGKLPVSLPGFMAFPSGAKAPFGMEFGSGMTRAVIPLHQPGSRLSGSFAVRVFEAGTHSVEASLVAMGKCGEEKLGAGVSSQIGAAPGQPEIVVQDPYDAEVPKQTLVSNSQRYLVQIFDGRYRVFDIATGAKLVDRAGHNPNFSPGSRFVVADTGDADGYNLEVIDLVSREVIATLSGPFAGWVNGDAFIIDGGARMGALSVRSSLISRAVPPQEEPARGWRVETPEDGLSLQHPGGCNACTSWSDSNMLLDVDRGVVIFSAGLDPQTPVYELASGYSSCCAKLDDAKKSAASVYGVNFAGLPGWHASTPIAFSHVYDALADPNGMNVKDQPWYKAAIPMRQQRVSHRELAPGAPAQQLAGFGLDSVVRGDWRAKVRSAAPAGANARDRLLAELARFGVQAAPSATDEALPFSNSPATAANAARYGKDGANMDKAIAARTAPYRQRLVKEVPAIAAFLTPAPAPVAAPAPVKKAPAGIPAVAPAAVKKAPAAAPAAVQAAFPYDGELAKAKIDLDDYLEGLWRWDIAGRPVWLMQLLTIEGSGAFGQGALFLLDGKAKTPIVNLSKALPGFWEGSYGRTGHQTRLKTRIFFGRYLVAASVISKTIAVYDIEAGQMVTLVRDAPQADLMDTVALSADGRHLIQVNSDGQFFLHETASGALALAGRAVDGEIIFYTPQGYYWSSYEGAHFVQLRFPGLAGLFPFKQFASALDRPDLIKARLGATGPLPPQPAPALTPPPALEARLLSPAGAATLEDRVLIDARASTGLARLRLYQDGQLVLDKEVKGPEFQGEVTVPHAAHPRSLTVLAIDTSGFVSIPQTLRLRPGSGATNRLHSIVTGVDTFADARLNLQYAKSDARRLAGALTSAGRRYYSAQKQTLLLDDEATMAAVTGALEKAVSEARAEDTILFSFAGHGVQGGDGRYYLTPAGFRAEDIAGSGLPWARLAEILGRSKARVIVVLDACHSGLSGSEGRGTNDDAVKALLSGARAPMLVLAASKGRQFSYEDAKWGGGVFTHALAGVLTSVSQSDLNANGTLEVSELYRALKTGVGRETAGEQTPWLVRQDVIGDFTLF